MSAGIGGGHDGVATELSRRLRLRGTTTRILDFVDLLPAALGPTVRELYRAQITTVPTTWAWVYRTFDRNRRSRLADNLVRVACRALHDAVGTDTRAVVSTYPLAGRAIGRLRAQGLLRVPAIAYLTDMAVHRLWVADGVDMHVTIHPGPARQARALGAAATVVAAPVVRPAAQRVPAAEKAALRARFGLPENARLALVAGGSWGVGDLRATVADVAATGRAVPVVVCGDNTRLRARLEADGIGHVVGWTDDFCDLIAAADVVVQNAGGLTSLETLACGVPLVSYRCVPGHGLANSQALAAAGLAPLVTGVDDLREVLTAPPPTIAAVGRLFDAPDAADVVMGIASGTATASKEATWKAG